MSAVELRIQEQFKKPLIQIKSSDSQKINQIKRPPEKKKIDQLSWLAKESDPGNSPSVSR